MLLLSCAFVVQGGDDNLLPDPSLKEGLKHWKTTFPEPNETKYARNHEWVTTESAPKASGKAITFTLNGKVAASEGVKASSPLIPVDAEKAYEFGADVLSSGCAVKIFIEGYKEDPEYTEAGNDRYPGFRRCYRCVIHYKGKPGQWQQAIQTFPIAKKGKRLALRKRHQPTHVLIKLYAYHPAGTVHFRNVFLRVSDAKVEPRLKDTKL
jgi:hypothetical protein